MKRWLQKTVRPFVGDILRKFPAVYDWYQNLYFGTLEKIKKRGLHKRGYAYADLITRTLKNEQFHFFYTYGTMLGLVRDGGFIGHDSDIDMGIIQDKGFSWEHLEETMAKIGMRKKHEFQFHQKVTEQTYMKDGVSVDFFLYVPYKDHFDTYAYYKEEGRTYERDQWSVAKYTNSPMRKMKGIVRHGARFVIPVNAEQYLEEIYGKGWRIPDPDWQPNRKKVEGVVGYIVRNI